MSELGRFQDAFARALAGDPERLAPWAPQGAEAEARLSVYCNTAAKGCADALAANFPTLVRAAGEAWMREAAIRFSREHPPTSPLLHAYGAQFPGWLADFAPTAEIPWLADLAAIDWAVRDALFAPDAEPLDAAAFAGLTPEAYAQTCVSLHPSATLLQFETGIPSLWRALHADPPPAHAELSPEPESLLVVRPALEIVTRPLTIGALAFLEACRQGRTLAEAGAAALGAQPELALAQTFADLISVGIFTCIRRSADAV